MTVQTSYTQMAAAFAGMVEGGMAKDARTLYNDLGNLSQISDVVIVAANSTAYAFTINGIPITYTSDATATQAEIRDGLIANARANILFENLVIFQPSGVNVRVIAKTPGVGFTYADADGNLSESVVRANVAQAEIPFGRGICKRSGSGTNERSAHLPTAPTAQVFTLTFTAVNSILYQLVFHGSDGRDYTVEYNSDGTATATEIRDGIQAAMVSMGVPLTAVDLNADALTVTSNDPNVTWTVDEDPTASIAFAETVPAVLNTFLGVSERVHSVVNTTTPGEGVAAGQAFSAVTKGRIWVEVEEAVVADTDQVWCRHTASGSNTALGRFRNDGDSNTCFRISSGAKYRKGSSGAGLALLELNLP